MTISTRIYFFLVLRTCKNWQYCLLFQFILRTLLETNNENYFPDIIGFWWPLFYCSHWKLLSLTYHLCPQNHCLFFALLSDHDAFGIMIFHQRNGKWFLRPKQRGLNSVDLFIKEPLFLLFTTADCAEETEKSRSRQHWAKNNNFSKIWVDQFAIWAVHILLQSFFHCSSQFSSTEMKNERYFKKNWCKRSPRWLKSFFSYVQKIWRNS